MMDKRGSVWRKWDLHVHTPDSIKEAYQGRGDDDAWEAFIKDLENLPEEFKVIGINDYIFLDGYKKVIEYQKKGRLTNIDLILPVIEFRIDKFTQKNQRINFHVIFSDRVSPELIESQFVTELGSKYKLSPGINGDYWDHLITKDSLAELGRKIINSVPEERKGDYQSPLVEGFHNLNVTLEDVKRAINKECFFNKVVTAVGKTEWADYKWNDASIAEKKNVINSVDLVFISSENPAEFQKAKNKLTEEKVNDKLIDCSDAHTNSWQTENKDRIGNSFTWIKADTTFKGLKQILIEPDRVFVGDTPPSVKRVRQNPTKYIDVLEIEKRPDSTMPEKWFENFKIDLNHELVAIIGNKGNGKSAIADTIGLVGNTHNYENFSFLDTKKFRSKRPYNRAACYTGVLVWNSGTSDRKLLSDNPEINVHEKVKYIPQNFLESLCVNEDEGEFEKELKKVIFSHLADSDKLNKGSLDELIEYQSEILVKESEGLISKLKIVNRDIQRLETKKSTEYKNKIEDLFKSKKEEKEAHLKNKPSEIKPPVEDESVQEQTKIVSKEIAKLREEVDATQKDISQAETQKKKLNEEVSELVIIKDDIGLIVKEYDSLKSGRSEDLKKYGIDFDVVVSLKTNFKLIDDQLKTRRHELETISKSLDENIEDSLTYKRARALERINVLKEKLDAPSKRYQEYLSELAIWDKKLYEIEGSDQVDGSLKYYKAELEYLDKALDLELDQKSEQRSLLSGEIFDKKQNMLEIYRNLFAPITRFIDEYGELMSNYEINLDASLKLENFENGFFNFVSRGSKGSFLGTEDGEMRLRDIISKFVFDSKEQIMNFQKELLDNLKFDMRSEPPEERKVSDQLRQYKEPFDLYDYLFSLEFLSPYYLLKLDTKKLEELSPGERGALLLIFYLILDKDTKPLVIDQPEENLDNNSVYNILVHFIKEAKKRRQVIIVTHNPNLAVVCDAEQVICMSIDKKDGNKVSFESGAIENPNINNQIVEILEGTYPAFDNRTHKYKVTR